MKRRLLWVLGMGALLPGADTPEDAAQAAAESWLKVVDAEDYGKSWDEASSLFKNVVTREQWTQAVAGVRGMYGKLGSRRIRSREAKQIPRAPEGKYVLVQFYAAFENGANATESVTLMLEAGGDWRVLGYEIR